MSPRAPQNVFLTGGTGYIGGPLVLELLRRGHRVRALVRPGSESKLSVPPEHRNSFEIVSGDPLRKDSFAGKIAPSDTFVQLVGVPHPSPAKTAEFRAIDRVSGLASVEAASAAGTSHFIYLSVAHPAPVMKTYIAVRAEVEEKIRAAGLNATILRPWYVLGPGHHWPHLIRPVYWLMERIPQTRASARRLGLCTHEQMIRALVEAVEDPPSGVRVLEVPAIRSGKAEA